MVTYRMIPTPLSVFGLIVVEGILLLNTVSLCGAFVTEGTVMFTKSCAAALDVVVTIIGYPIIIFVYIFIMPAVILFVSGIYAYTLFACVMGGVTARTHPKYVVQAGMSSTLLGFFILVVFAGTEAIHPRPGMSGAIGVPSRLFLWPGAWLVGGIVLLAFSRLPYTVASKVGDEVLRDGE